MTSLNRIRVLWQGSPVVGPGLSTFYLASAPDTVSGNLVTFFNALKLMFPAPLQWVVPSSGDKIDSATGALAGSWSTGTGGGTVVATGTSAYAAGVGAQIRWRTNGIVGGRRVVGSTFLVPIVTPGYDTSGTLENTNRGAIVTAATALLTAEPSLTIWSRPVPPPTPPATSPTARAGEANTVIALDVPDRVSWLRTRRT